VKQIAIEVALVAISRVLGMRSFHIVFPAARNSAFRSERDAVFAAASSAALAAAWDAA